MTENDQYGQRLARLEVEMATLKEALQPLRGRDAELDSALRTATRDFADALQKQSAAFAAAMERQAALYVAKTEWELWRSLLTAALFAIVGLGWTTLVGRH